MFYLRSVKSDETSKIRILRYGCRNSTIRYCYEARNSKFRIYTFSFIKTLDGGGKNGDQRWWSKVNILTKVVRGRFERNEAVSSDFFLSRSQM